MSEVDEIRAQLQHVVKLTDAAGDRPTPTNECEAQQLVVAVATAREAMTVLMLQIDVMLRAATTPTEEEERQLRQLLAECARASQRMLDVSRRALTAARNRGAHWLN